MEGVTTMESVARVQRTLLRISKIFEYVGWVLLLGWVVLMTLGVVLRYFFKSPLLFQSDVVSLMLVLFCTFCFAPIFLEKGHIRVDMITRRLPEKIQNILWLFVDIVTILAAVLMAISSKELIAHSLNVTARLEISGILLAPFQFCIPVGFVLLGAVVSLDLCQRIKLMKEEHQAKPRRETERDQGPG